MKTTGIKAMAVIVLAATILASQALAQPPGGGPGRAGRQGWGRGMRSGPRTGANLESIQPDEFRAPRGPYCPWGQGPNQNIQGRQGRGSGGFGQGLQGRGICPAGRGFRRQDMITQRGPMVGRGTRGLAMQGRGGRGFQRRNIAPQGRRMNGRQGQFRPKGIGRPGPGIQPRRFAPEDKEQWMPPRARGWAPGARQGRGWRQGMGSGWRQNPQPETAPDANAPKPPIVEDQPEIPQVE